MKRTSLLLSLLLTFVTLGLGACAAGGDGPGQVADGAEQADGVTQLDGYHPDGGSDTSPGDGTPGEDGKVPDGEGQPDAGPVGASIHGRLAAPAAPDQRNFTFGDKPAPSPQVPKSLSLVSVDLLRADQGTPPANWTVEKNALPDQDGAFAFEGLTEGNYALRVNQPEFAALAYSVDSTEFHLGADQSVSLVLPLLTTITHGLTDPRLRQSQNGPPPILATLDHSTGEVIMLSTLGLGLVNPDTGTLDLLFSRNFFPGNAVLAVAPNTGVIWLLYPNRIVRVDRSVFQDAGASEILNLDDPATRLAVGDKVRFKMLSAPAGFGGWYFEGRSYFSPDELTLFASTQSSGVTVIDLQTLSIGRVILGRVIGYNPVSNHLFFTNGQGQRMGGTEVLVVDASTKLEVSVVPFENVLGVAPMPQQALTVMVGGKLSSGDLQVPFIKVVDGSGEVVVDQRARDYLGLANDPKAGAPSFDVSGQYFILGSAAFKLLPEGGFEAVPTGIAPGQFFSQRMQQNQQRALDPAHLYELWYGDWQPNASVGLLSLNGSNLPVAVRPGVPVTQLLLDQTRGRAIFWNADKLVLIHYADPNGAALPETLDLAPLVAALVPEGAPCSADNPCTGTDLCAGATDTSFSGHCTANPRLPFLPFCGGFTGATCDEDYTCKTVNPTNPNATGQCLGLPSRDYAAHGPACTEALPCPAGMACNANGHCQPKTCLRDADCDALSGEICGLVQNLGRVCLTPGSLPDDSPCLSSSECLHGACIPIEGAYAMASNGTMNDILSGTLGLQVCTTPCFEGDDCPGGQPCVYQQSYGAPNYLGAETVWRTHRVQLAPFCWPSVQPPVEGCTDKCLPSQLCSLGYYDGTCRVGYEPVAWVKNGEGSSTFCLPPAEANGGCRFPCLRSGDCPFTTNCDGGFCSAGSPFSSPCKQLCGPEESCAYLSGTVAADPFAFCVASDSCASDADCGGTMGACHGACLQACTTNADCPGGECAVTVPMIFSSRYCVPTTCNCTGPHAADMVCDLPTSKCVIQGACTDVPCDGSVLAQCGLSVPDPLPIFCQCPACPWNATQCGGPASLCPEGFTCTAGSAPLGGDHRGQTCTCTSAECQAQE
jgi:hypothetical protein